MPYNIDGIHNFMGLDKSPKTFAKLTSDCEEDQV